MQARALAPNYFSSLGLPYPGGFLDPAHEFFPMRPPFILDVGGTPRAIFSPAAAVMQSGLVAVAGIRGLIGLLGPDHPAGGDAARSPGPADGGCDRAGDRKPALVLRGQWVGARSSGRALDGRPSPSDSPHRGAFLTSSPAYSLDVPRPSATKRSFSHQVC